MPKEKHLVEKYTIEDLIKVNELSKHFGYDLSKLDLNSSAFMIANILNTIDNDGVQNLPN